VAKIAFILSVCVILFLTLGGDHILVLFLGNKWHNTGLISLIMSICFVPIIMTEPLMSAFRVYNCQGIRFKYDLAQLCNSVIGLALTSVLFRNLYMSLAVYSIGYAIVRFLILKHIYRITGITVSQVSKCFYLVIISSYILLIVRIIISYEKIYF